MSDARNFLSDQLTRLRVIHNLLAPLTVSEVCKCSKSYQCLTCGAVADLRAEIGIVQTRLDEVQAEQIRGRLLPVAGLVPWGVDPDGRIARAIPDPGEAA